jgi:spermidine/putrescine transport system ATP-binding protein
MSTATPSVELKNVVKQYKDSRTGQIVNAINNVSLSIAEGEFFAMLGPSGCGKTTTLRAIAGFENPDTGEILIRGKAVQGIPPFHRPVNTVFQDYALFPHMTILQNVMFGLKMAGVANDEANKRATEALELVRLPNVAARKPWQLSGGQRQRIALARALVNRPAVLLLDEPLGALDLKLRKTMQYELKTMQREVGITFVFVTHDQEEALTMADRIAVMSEGNVLQVGKPDDIYERPTSRFVADFIGETNFIEGILAGKQGDSGHVKLADGRTLEAPLNNHTIPIGQSATLAIRPERIMLSSNGATTAGTTQLKGKIAEVQYIGTDMRYHVDAGGNVSLVVRAQNLDNEGSDRYQIGQDVVVAWKNSNASILS